MSREPWLEAPRKQRSQKTRPKHARSDRFGSKHNTAKKNTVAPSSPAVPLKGVRTLVKTAAQRAERVASDARQLAAVSGVVIPSKVPSGQLPNQGRWKEDERMIYPCSICGRKFARKHHVQSHMAPCVKRNGNPNGACWDDAWKDGATQVVSMDAQQNARQKLRIKDDQTQEDRIQDNETDDELEDEQSAEDRPDARKLPTLWFA